MNSEQNNTPKFKREIRNIRVKRKIKTNDLFSFAILVILIGLIVILYKKTDWELVKSVPTSEVSKQISPFKKNWITKISTDTELEVPEVELEPRVENLIVEKSKKHNLNPALVKAIIEQESGYQNHAIKYEATWEKEYAWKFPRKKYLNQEMWKMNFHSIGLMQISYAIWKDYCNLNNYTDLFDPSKNIECGAKILAGCMESGKSKSQCVKEYNGSGVKAEEYKQQVLTRFARLNKIERKFERLG